MATKLASRTPSSVPDYQKLAGNYLATGISGPGTANDGARRSGENPNENQPPATGNPGGDTGGGNYAPAVRGSKVIYLGVPGQAYDPGYYSSLYPSTGTKYLVDESGNFLAGNPTTYANEYAGAYPQGALGSYSDATSLAEINTANNNLGAALAGFDKNEGSVKASFAELMGLLGRNKGKNLGSLADAMADKGLTQSGIFLKGTGDIEQSYADQTSQQTRVKDDQLSSIAQQRLNAETARTNAVNKAQQDALDRVINAWKLAYEQAKKAADQRLADLKANGINA